MQYTPMTVPRLLQALTLYYLAHVVTGFSLLRTASTSLACEGRFHVPKSLPFVSSTCLHADAQDADDEEAAPAKEGGESETEESDEESGTDILSSPAFLARKIDVLKSDIAKAEEDLEATNLLVQQGKAEWGPQLDDLQNEYKNIQERMSKQNSSGDTEATVQVVRKMLDVLDTFDRGFGAVTAETEAQQVIEAEYRQVYSMISDTFAELGVTEVPTVGTEFDYEVHQAVMQRPSDEYEEGIVCEELQKGYILDDTLVRAAMVSVAA